MGKSTWCHFWEIFPSFIPKKPTLGIPHPSFFPFSLEGKGGIILILFQEKKSGFNWLKIGFFSCFEPEICVFIHEVELSRGLLKSLFFSFSPHPLPAKNSSFKWKVSLLTGKREFWQRLHHPEAQIQEISGTSHNDPIPDASL